VVLSILPYAALHWIGQPGTSQRHLEPRYFVLGKNSINLSPHPPFIAEGSLADALKSVGGTVTSGQIMHHHVLKR
jgi:hypothetical protein